MRLPLSDAARILATAWLCLSLFLCCSIICICNLIGRLVCFLVIFPSRGWRVHQHAVCYWSSWLADGGTVFLCLLMAAVWQVDIVDNVSIDGPEDLATDQENMQHDSTETTCVSDVKDENMRPPAKTSSSNMGGKASRKAQGGSHAATKTENLSESLKFVDSVIPPKKVQIQESVAAPDVRGMSISSLVLKAFFPALFPRDKKDFIRRTKYVIMCNHTSTADGFLLRAATFGWTQGCKMVYKGDLNGIPLFGWTFKLSGDLPIHFLTSKISEFGVVKGTVAPMMEIAKNYLADGMCIALFPEGARSLDGELKPFREGFFRLCMEENIHIIPTALVNSRCVWRPAEYLVRIGRVQVLRTNSSISPEGKSMESLKAEVATAMKNMIKNYELAASTS